MKLERDGELYLGIGMFGFGIFYFILSNLLPKNSGVNSSTIPLILATLIIVLGILQTITGYRIRKKIDEDTVAEDNNEVVDYKTVLKTLGVIGIYIALLRGLGFILSSTIYLYVQIILLTPKDKKKNYLVYGIIAVVASTVIYVTFKSGLDLMLPAGILG